MTVRAKKHLGQHFLKDEDTAKNIANTLTEVGYDNILEIGPGMGMLTKYLLDKKAKITVMEIDRDSVAFLKEEFRNEYINLDTSANNFEIIEGDFLKHDLSTFFNNQQVAIIGNYPYNISSQIIFINLLIIFAYIINNNLRNRDNKHMYTKYVLCFFPF